MRTNIIPTRLTDAQVRRLDEACERCGTTRSDFIRALIDAACGRPGDEQAAMKVAKRAAVKASKDLERNRK